MLQTIVALQNLSEGVRDRLHGEEGATAVEYGLLVALIAAVIIVAVGLLGTQINAAFQTVLTNLGP